MFRRNAQKLSILAPFVRCELTDDALLGELQKTLWGHRGGDLPIKFPQSSCLVSGRGEDIVSVS